MSLPSQLAFAPRTGIAPAAASPFSPGGVNRHAAASSAVAERRVVLRPHPELAVRAAQVGQVAVEPLIAGHSDPVQRSVKAVSLTVHRRREHGADLGFGGEEPTVEIRHREVRNGFFQEEWRCGRDGGS
jgi:hypothetical protein